jgi:hypothetical protein
LNTTDISMFYQTKTGWLLLVVFFVLCVWLLSVEQKVVQFRRWRFKSACIVPTYVLIHRHIDSFCCSLVVAITVIFSNYLASLTTADNTFYVGMDVFFEFRSCVHSDFTLQSRKPSPEWCICKHTGGSLSTNNFCQLLWFQKPRKFRGARILICTEVLGTGRYTRRFRNVLESTLRTSHTSKRDRKRDCMSMRRCQWSFASLQPLIGMRNERT